MGRERRRGRWHEPRVCASHRGPTGDPLRAAPPGQAERGRGRPEAGGGGQRPGRGSARRGRRRRRRRRRRPTRARGPASTGTAGWSMTVPPSLTSAPAAPRLIATMRGPAASAGAIASSADATSNSIRASSSSHSSTSQWRTTSATCGSQGAGVSTSGNCGSIEVRHRPRARRSKTSAMPRCHMSGKWSRPPEWTRVGGGRARRPGAAAGRATARSRASAPPAAA